MEKKALLKKALTINSVGILVKITNPIIKEHQASLRDYNRNLGFDIPNNQKGIENWFYCRQASYQHLYQDISTINKSKPKI